MKKHTVYALTEPNDISDIKYIGYTSLNPLIRLGHHLSSMRRNQGRKDEWLNKLSQPPLILILNVFDTAKEALSKEKELITSYEIKGVVLFNELSNFKRRHINQKKVYQYNLKGEFIAEHESAGELAASNLFFKYKIINACCNGSKKTHYGFMFSYEKHKKIKPFKRKKSAQGTKVYQYTLENIFIKEFSNSQEAARETYKGTGSWKTRAGDILKCINPEKYKNKTAGGFIWRRDKV